MPEPFVHLHCHTDRSFLDGVGRSAEYVELAAKHGQTALAITDHGNLHGLPEHRRACKEADIKPIYGCEMYVVEDRERAKEVVTKARGEKLDKSMIDPTYTDSHLVVLCANATGWRNMLALNHDAVLNGYFYKPRTTHDMVMQHAEGLIATTACLGSQFAAHFRRNDEKAMRRLLGKYKDAFGDRFFCELQVNETDEQNAYNGALLAQAKKLGIRPVLTNDVHYACACDAPRQDEMVSVARHVKMNDEKYWKPGFRGLWFATAEDIFGWAKKRGYDLDRATWRQAARNTVEVAAMCDVDIYGDGALRPPKFIDESGGQVADAFDELKQRAAAGYKLMRRQGLFGDRESEYAERFKHELRVIRTCGMADFYLVTMDITDYCRTNGIFVWARGSGCASLVAAVLGITPIDPVRFGLLFERFVDPHRANAPDFDLDIDATRRQEVIDWLVKKYGGANGERIARILSLSTFGLKGAIKDVCFAHDVPDKQRFSLADAADRIAPTHEAALADSTPMDRERTIESAREALVKEARGDGKALIEQRPEIIDAALTMVGRVHGRTRHAAGYVVAPDALIHHMPIDRLGSGKEAVITTAWGEGLATQDIGPTGLMKVDLLGLVTCGVVSKCVGMIAARGGQDVRMIREEIDGWKMNYSSPAVAREYATGNGFGLHQLQESGQFLAGFAKRLKPKDVDAVVAMVALYRPGSMEFLDEYLSRAHGKSRVPKVDPIIDEVCAETYGIMVYQEQVMRVLHLFGGLELRGAYAVIKAISKKRESEIEAARQQFINGAQKRGRSAQLGAKVFDLIQKFAGYGFNKAHAASYAALSWATAHLRAKYPVEFYWAWLDSTDNAKTKNDGERKVESFMRAASRSKIEVLRPTIARSTSRWRIDKHGRLVAPLSLIVGVGDAAAEAVNDGYAQHKWENVWAFLDWCDENKRLVNSKAVRAMAMAGALSSVGVKTSRAHDLVNAWVDLRTTKRDGTRTAQLKRLVKNDPKRFFVTPDTDTVAAAFERTAFGFCFWNNPWTVGDRTEKLLRLIDRGLVADETQQRVRGKRRAFHLISRRVIKDKRGRAMAFLTLSTPGGSRVEGIAFSSAWAAHGKTLRPDRVLLIGGDFDAKGVYLVSDRPKAVVTLDSAIVR